MNRRICEASFEVVVLVPETIWKSYKTKKSVINTCRNLNLLLFKLKQIKRHIKIISQYRIENAVCHICHCHFYLSFIKNIKYIRLYIDWPRPSNYAAFKPVDSFIYIQIKSYNTSYYLLYKLVLYNCTILQGHKTMRSKIELLPSSTD